MNAQEVAAQIASAFADTPPPGNDFTDISATMDDEGMVEYFQRTTWRGHRTYDLRCQSAALNFFTDRAYRYWLPAFMLAELEDPVEADVIAGSIAFSLETRKPVQLFTPNEWSAIAAFLSECARRYDYEDDRTFEDTARFLGLKSV